MGLHTTGRHMGVHRTVPPILLGTVGWDWSTLWDTWESIGQAYLKCVTHMSIYIVQHGSPQDSPTMDRVDSPMWTVESDGRLGQPSMRPSTALVKGALARFSVHVAEER